MGLRPQIISTPQAFADLAQNAARFQAAFESSAINQMLNETKAKLEHFQKLMQPEIEKIVKAGKLIKQHFVNAFGKVKTWVKKLFVKYLPIALPLFEIPRAQIQPNFGKASKLANSYRSHSPPFYSVIK
jgi:hypothetical protein